MEKPLVLEFQKFISDQIYKYVILNDNHYTGEEEGGIMNEDDAQQ